MASIYDDGLFKLQIFHDSIAAPGDPWVTNYVFDAVGMDIAAAGPEVADAFANFECEFLVQDVICTHATVSTYDAEPGTYDPSTFMVIELGESYTGVRDEPGLFAGRDTVLNFKRNVGAGHQGKIALRGALYASEFGAINAGGKIAFAPGIAVAFEVIMAGAEALILPYCEESSDFISLVMVNRDEGGFLNRRKVIALSVRGPSTNKGNHRYFDREA